MTLGTNTCTWNGSNVQLLCSMEHLLRVPCMSLSLFVHPCSDSHQGQAPTRCCLWLWSRMRMPGIVNASGAQVHITTTCYYFMLLLPVLDRTTLQNKEEMEGVGEKDGRKAGEKLNKWAIYISPICIQQSSCWNCTHLIRPHNAHYQAKGNIYRENNVSPQCYLFQESHLRYASDFLSNSINNQFKGQPKSHSPLFTTCR